MPRHRPVRSGPVLALALAALVGAPGTAPAQEVQEAQRAQEAQQPQQPQACTWDACALRVEGGVLLQGVAGVPRGRVDGIDLDVGILAEGPDSAAAYAARFSVARPRSDLWSTFGDLGRGLALAAWIHFALADTGDGWAWTAATLMPVSQAARAHARRHDVIADRALERSVWWYNRDLAAPGLLPPTAGMTPLPAERSLWDLAPLGGGVLGGLLTGLLTNDTGWVVTGILLGTSIGNGFADRQLHPD